MQKANYMPIYCAIYPDLAEIARNHGYALAIHGSLARYFDLICIPWVESPSGSQVVINEMCRTFAIKEVGESIVKEHGRKVHTLSIVHGECFIDLSFTPRQYK